MRLQKKKLKLLKIQFKLIIRYKILFIKFFIITYRYYNKIPTHKSSDYKLSAVKYYLSHSKNQVQTCKIFGCSEKKFNEMGR